MTDIINLTKTFILLLDTLLAECIIELHGKKLKLRVYCKLKNRIYFFSPLHDQ